MAKKPDDYSQLTNQQLEEFLKQPNLARDEQEKLLNELTRRLTEELVSKAQGEKLVNVQGASNVVQEDRQESTLPKSKKAKKNASSIANSSELSSDTKESKLVPVTNKTSDSDDGCGTTVGVGVVVVAVGYFLTQCTV